MNTRWGLAINRNILVLALLIPMSCSRPADAPPPCPADSISEEESEDLFAFGKVVEVTRHHVKIKEYDFGQDAEVVSSYLVTRNTELGNLEKLADLKPDDRVVLDFVMRGWKRVATMIVKETDECGADVDDEPSASGITIAPNVQQIGAAGEGGGIMRAVSGMMALTSDDPEAQQRWAALEREVPPPSTDEEPAAEYLSLHEILLPGQLPDKAAADQERVFGPFRLYIWRGSYFSSDLALWRGTNLIIAARGFALATSGPLRPSTPEEEPFSYFEGPPAGTDLDLDGVPDLLLYDYSGGAHCCSSVKHIVCSDPPTLTAEISAWHSKPTYTDLDGDGRYEMSLDDSAYAYWNACFAGSPAPRVIFRIKNGRYEMAGDLMRQGAPPHDEIAGKIEALRFRLSRTDVYRARWAEEGETDRPLTDEERRDDDFFMGQAWRTEHVAIPSQVWDLLLELIYSGQVDQALEALDTMWPKGKPDQGDFARELLAMITGSWYGARLPWFNNMMAAFEGKYPAP